MAGQLEQKGKQMKVQNLPAREIPGNEAAGVGGREAYWIAYWITYKVSYWITYRIGVALQIKTA